MADETQAVQLHNTEGTNAVEQKQTTESTKREEPHHPRETFLPMRISFDPTQFFAAMMRAARTAYSLPSGMDPARQARSCDCSAEVGRNLVVCIDGTSNQFGEKNTNVIELYHLLNLKKDKNQLVFYNSGIGTYARPSWRFGITFAMQLISHKIDLAIAWNFEKTVMAAYAWLADKYRPNDRIFLFGFSRGAYQVRCLSAMIEQVGLMEGGNEAQIPFAYELYADSGNSQKTRDVAKNFKETFGRPAKVHFIGAWDTVSSVGAFRNRTLPGATSGMTHACYFRHALALDEKRWYFHPEYAYEHGWLQGQNNAHGADTSNNPHIKEVWFAGSHSDIGGGNVPNLERNRRQPSLRWMYYEASAMGLRMAPFRYETEWELNSPKEVHESHTWGWKVLEVFMWLVWVFFYLHGLTHERPVVPRIGHSRYLYPGQKIHSSVLPQSNDAYMPKALLKYYRHLTSWEGLRVLEDGDPLPPFIEQDLRDLVRRLVSDLTSPSSSENKSLSFDSIKRLVDLLCSPDGCRAVREVILAVSKPELQWALPVDIQSYMSRVIGNRATGKDSPDLRHDVPSSVAVSADGKLVAVVTALGHSIDVCVAMPVPGDLQVLQTSKDHNDVITSLAFSPDETQIASGSWDHTVRIWNIRTTESVVINEHSAAVTCVVYSADGQFVASGSLNGDIIVASIAHIAPRQQPPLMLHAESPVTTLSFSSNNDVLAAGYYDHTIRLWTIRPTSLDDDFSIYHEMEPPSHRVLRGHTAPIITLATSPDGHYLVSSSYDSTLRKWNIADDASSTHVILHGHIHWITSLTFSRDGQYIVSASRNGSCRVWSTLSGRTVHLFHRNGDWIYCARLFEVNHGSTVDPPHRRSILIGSFDRGIDNATSIDLSDVTLQGLHGHSGPIEAIAFSPDGSRLVTGSKDATIRIWDVTTGCEALGPLTGHTGSVRAVQFSPDGTLVVSGSEDGTVRVWNAETGEQDGKPIQEVSSDMIYSVAISPDGKYVVSGSAAGLMRVWRLETRSEAYNSRRSTVTGQVRSVQYSPPDGQYIASGSTDGMIRMWDAMKGTLVGTPFAAHPNKTIFSIAFSPDGTRIVSGSSDQTLRIWEATTGTAVGEPLRGHTENVLSVAYSPDGKRIVSSSGDRSVRLWDAETGERVLGPLEGHTDLVRSVAISSNYIASASPDKTIRLWDIQTGKPVMF